MVFKNKIYNNTLDKPRTFANEAALRLSKIGSLGVR